MLDCRRLDRQIKEMKKTYGFDGNPPRKTGAIERWFGEAWDNLWAALMAALFGSLRIALFFLFAGLMLLALPAILQWR